MAEDNAKHLSVIRAALADGEKISPTKKTLAGCKPSIPLLMGEVQQEWGDKRIAKLNASSVREHIEQEVLRLRYPDNIKIMTLLSTSTHLDESILNSMAGGEMKELQRVIKNIVVSKSIRR